MRDNQDSPQSPQEEFCDIIGKALAGNGRLGDGRTLADKYPEKYANPLTDWVNLIIIQAKINRAAAAKDDQNKEVVAT